MKFIKTTIIGGLVFLIPVGLIAIVLLKIYSAMLKAAQPMSAIVPIDYIGGITVANILAVLIILAICFMAGLLARIGPVARSVDRAETAILQKLPGYTVFKGMTSTLSPDQEQTLKPVIVTMPGSARIGLEVGRLDGGRVVVFYPGAPSTWSGSVHLVEEERVERIDVPMKAVIEHTEQLGKNSEAILAGSSLVARREDVNDTVR